MKKSLSLLLSLALMFSLFAGIGGEKAEALQYFMDQDALKYESTVWGTMGERTKVTKDGKYLVSDAFVSNASTGISTDLTKEVVKKFPGYKVLSAEPYDSGTRLFLNANNSTNYLQLSYNIATKEVVKLDTGFTGRANMDISETRLVSGTQVYNLQTGETLSIPVDFEVNSRLTTSMYYLIGDSGFLTQYQEGSEFVVASFNINTGELIREYGRYTKRVSVSQGSSNEFTHMYYVDPDKVAHIVDLSTGDSFTAFSLSGNADSRLSVDMDKGVVGFDGGIHFLDSGIFIPVFKELYPEPVGLFIAENFKIYIQHEPNKSRVFDYSGLYNRVLNGTGIPELGENFKVDFFKYGKLGLSGNGYLYSGVDIYINDELKNMSDLKFIVPKQFELPKGEVELKYVPYLYKRDSSGSIVKEYGESKTFSFNTEEETYDTEIIKMGTKNVTKGKFVEIGPYLWRTMGDNTLVMASKYKSGPVDIKEGYNPLDPTRTTSVLHELNTVLYSQFSEDEKSLLKDRIWKLTENPDKEYRTVYSKISLPTLYHFEKYPYPLDSVSSNIVLMNFTSNTSVYTIDNLGVFRNTSTGIQVNLSWFPVLSLDPEVGIVSGEGTKASPYKLGLGVVEETPPAKPENLRVDKITDNIANIQWDTVNGVEYVLSDGFSILYQGTNGSFLHTSIEKGKSYKFALIPTKGSLIGETAFVDYIVEEEVTPPGDVKNLSITENSDTSITIAFTNEPGVTYKLTHEDEVYEITSPYTVDNLVPGQSYSYTITPERQGVKGNPLTFAYTIEIDTEDEVTEVSDLSVINVTPYSVEFTWTAVEGAEKYIVEIDGVVIAELLGTVNNITDTVPTLGNHTVTVKTVKNGVTSPGVSVTYTIPEPPETLDSDITEINFSDITRNTIRITWNFVQDATDYQVLRDGVEIAVVGDVVNNYVDRNAPLDTELNYTVKALVYGEYTEGLTKTVRSMYPEPELPTDGSYEVKAEKVNSTVIKVSWGPIVWADEYVLTYFGNEIYRGTGNSYHHTSVNTNEMAEYQIIAKRGNESSNPVSIIYTPDIPSVEDVNHFAVRNATENEITLEWDTPIQGKGFKLYKNGELYRSFLNQTTEFTDRNLTPNTSYMYKLVVVGEGSVSEGKTVVGITTNVLKKLTVEQLNSVVLATNQDGDLEVSWADLTEVTGATVKVGGLTFTSQGTGVVLQGVDVNSIQNLTITFSDDQDTYEDEVIVYNPFEVAPDKVTGLTVVRAHHDGAVLKWNQVLGATGYRVIVDGNVIYEGVQNTIRDLTAIAGTSVEYNVYAINPYGSSEPEIVTVQLPEEPVTINVSPPTTPPLQGTVTVDFQVVDGVTAYYTSRNPGWVHELQADGSYLVTYTNSSTGVTINHGYVFPVNGKLTFTDEEVIPGQNYNYNIKGVKFGPNGEEVVVADKDITVTTPTDGGGATVTPPSTGGGNTGGNGGNVGGGGGFIPPVIDSGKDKDEDKDEGEKKEEIPGNLLTNILSCDLKGEVIDFLDITGHWAKGSITKANSLGIINGYADKTYKPNGELTRAEFVAMLMRTLCLEEIQTKHSFEDVVKGSWYEGYVAQAQSYGIVEGTSDTTFSPTKNITRQEVATILGRLVLVSGVKEELSDEVVESILSDFTDGNKVSSYAKGHMASMVELGVLKGSLGTLNPLKGITRAEISAVILRFVEEVK